jgi:hypothetical protein
MKQVVLGVRRRAMLLLGLVAALSVSIAMAALLTRERNRRYEAHMHKQTDQWKRPRPDSSQAER